MTIEKHANLVTKGDYAIDLVVKFSQLIPAIQRLQFKAYSSLPTLDERVDESPAIGLMDRVSELRKLTEDLIPYWELVFAVTWQSELSEQFIREALRHRPADEAIDIFETNVDSVADTLTKKIETLPDDAAIAICSRCITVDGSIKHIPMMDFRCKPTESNLKKLKIALHQMGQKHGALIQSGRSFHFYGFDLLTEDGWRKYLAQSLLMAPIADSRYIAHRLIEGVGSLRITNCRPKPDKPFVVDLL